MIRSLAVSGALTIAVAASTALSAQPEWVESGVNFVWDSLATQLTPALTIGCGQQTSDVANFCLSPKEDYATLPLIPPTPNDGGQYFCYAVRGTLPPLPAQNFNPNTYSFQCSQIPPYTDNTPRAALIGANDGGLTSNAGFLGTIFRQDAGGVQWQPWFRNGDEVLFDIGPQANFTWAAPAPLTGLALTSIDQSFYAGTATFTNAPPFVKTVPLPKIFTTGYIAELQIGNFSTVAGASALPSAQIRVLSADSTGTTQWIGEATTGPVNSGGTKGANPGAGFPRIASYHVDFSDQLWTSTVTGIALDMSAAPPAGNQEVVVSVILHGYHEQELK